MQFDPISLQKFEAITSGGILNTALVVTPPIERVERAAKALGVTYKVSAKADGSLDFSTYDLALDTALETQDYGDITIAEAMELIATTHGSKIRCQSPVRDSSSFAAFMALGADAKPFIYDSGTGTKHWLRDLDWATAKNKDAAEIMPLFALSSAGVQKYLGSEPPERCWLLTDCLPEKKVGMVVAKGGTGKSMLMLQLAICIATGEDFVGAWQIGEPGAVLLLCAEDDEEEIHRRFYTCTNTMAQGVNDSAEFYKRLDTNLYVKSMVAENNLMTITSSEGEVTQTDYVQRLALTVAEVPNLKLIIVDPASRFRGGDENASQDATRFVEALEALAKATGAAVLLVHHMNKGSSSSAEPSQDASRGSSALTDGVRWQMNLATFTKAEAKEYDFLENERGFYLTATITKNNYAAPQTPVLIKRGDGGYLHSIDLASSKEHKATHTLSKVIELVRSEAKNGVLHTKTGFENKFGGLEGQLSIGKVALRKLIDDAIKSGKLVQRSKKLYPSDSPVPKAKLKLEGEH
jgi:hypothetical protein